MKKILHQFVLAVFCLSVAWGSLEWFSEVRGFVLDEQREVLAVLEVGTKADFQKGSGPVREVSSTQPMAVDDVIAARAEGGVRLTFPGGAEVRLAPQSRVKLFSIGGEENAYHLELQSGETWVITQGASRPVFLYVLGGVAVYPQDSAVNVRFAQNVVDIFGARNPVRVGLHTAVQQPTTSVKLLNSVLVSEGNQLSVALSKIQPKLEKLLYSKLVKEFQYAPVSLESLRQNTWYQSNYVKDKDRREGLLKRVVDAIKDRGLAVSDPESLYSSLIERMRNGRALMTFDPRKREEQRVASALVSLDDAIYFYATSQQASGDKRMAYFQSQLQALSLDSSMMSVMGDALWQRFINYSLFIPQDGPLFRIRSQLRDTLLSLQGDHTLTFSRVAPLVRSYLFDIYQSLSVDSSQGQQLLSAYFKAFRKIFTSYSGDIAKHPNVLAEENQILTHMYLRDPMFYKDPHFQALFDLQSQWLSLLPAGRDKDEENQTLVASKIDLMKKLRFFFFGEKIAVNDASAVLFRLLSDISSAIYQTDAAVAQYFKDNLDAQQDFWLYLNTTDFAESKIYGSTNRERFEAFLKNKKDVAEIDKLQQGLLGTIAINAPESKQTLEDIQKIFAEVGVVNVKLSPLLDKDQSQVFVESAEYNSIPFSCIYDRDKRLISDVKVYSEVILAAAVPLEKIKNILQVKPQQQMFSSADPVPTSQEDRVEKVAKLFLLKKLQELAFSLDVSQIGTLNYAKKLFSVKGAKLLFDKSQIEVDFVINLMNNSVSQVKVFILTEQQSMPGEFTLGGIADAVKKFYEVQFYKSLEEKQE